MDRSRLAAVALVAALAGCARHYLVNENALVQAQSHAGERVAVSAVRVEDRNRVVFVDADALQREDQHRARVYNTWWVGTAFFFGLSGASLAATVGLLIDAKLCTGWFCSFGPNLGASITGGVSGLFLLAGIATAIVATRAHPGEVRAGERGVVYVGADGVIHF